MINVYFDTPAVVIDYQKLLYNIQDMATYAAEHNFALRPHVKAHRLPQIAKLQIEHGATGFTCAKISEAAMLLAHQHNDFLLAHQLAGPIKMKKLNQLLEQADVIIGCDSVEGASLLQQLATERAQTINIALEVDSGLHRCGTQPGSETLELAIAIRRQCPNLRIKGLFTHAGQAYAATSREQLREIAKIEAHSVVDTAALLTANGFSIDLISVGSTPTAQFSHLVPGVNEIRPGNYVFYDAIQVGLGVVPQERCALTVVATVISRPAADRVVIDTGSKVLGLDKGAHGISLVRGFGILLGWPHLSLERLSEEHGVIIKTADGPLPEIGQQIAIIPNHACPVLYRADLVHVTGLNEETVWPSAMRGSR